MVKIVANVVADGRGDVPGARELEQKLNRKPGQSVAVVNAPPERGRGRYLPQAEPDQADVVMAPESGLRTWHGSGP